MDGQAEMAPLSADDVAQFLIDNPEADGADDQQEQVPTDESTSDEDTDAPETDDDSPDDADDESDEQPDPTSGRKYKVTVKGEDGADLEQEVDEKNLSQATSGTRITPARPQSLRGEKSRPWRSCAPKVSEAQNHYVQQAQMAQALVARLAGLRSPEEMLELSRQDPAAYVAEQAGSSRCTA